MPTGGSCRAWHRYEPRDVGPGMSARIIAAYPQTNCEPCRPSRRAATDRRQGVHRWSPRDVSRWCRFAPDVAAAAQPGGQSLPLAESSSGDGGAEHDRTGLPLPSRGSGLWLALLGRQAGYWLPVVAGRIPPRDGRGAHRQALHYGRVGRCTAATARCREAPGRCDSAVRRHRAIGLELKCGDA